MAPIPEMAAGRRHACGMVLETPVEIPADVGKALANLAPSLGEESFVLLPTHTRTSITYYTEEDLDAYGIAIREGLDVAFLHDGADRRYLHENAAGWELTVAIAIAENLAAGGLINLVKFLWARVRSAKDQGLYEGEDISMPMKLTVTRVKHDTSTGAVTTESVCFEGRSDEVVDAAQGMFGSSDE